VENRGLFKRLLVDLVAFYKIILSMGLTVLLAPLFLITIYLLIEYTTLFKSIAGWLIEHKDLFPLIGPTLLLITFSIDRYFAYKIRKKETYRSWYIKTLIDPHLKEVEAFFSDLPDLYKESCKSLKKSKKSMMEEDSLALQTKLNESFQKKKEKIEYEFIIIVAYNNSKIADKITGVINDVEDIFTTNLDNTEDNYHYVNGQFAVCKARVYSILSQPLDY
jgi:hypothetical protein